MYSGAYSYFILICVDVTVELFGSSLSGFALMESDVNINLNYPAQEDEKTNVSLKKLVGLGCIAGKITEFTRGFIHQMFRQLPTPLKKAAVSCRNVC